MGAPGRLHCPAGTRVRGGEAGGSARPGARRPKNSEGTGTGAGIPSCPVASVMDGIDDRLAAWLERQPVDEAVVW